MDGPLSYVRNSPLGVSVPFAPLEQRADNTDCFALKSRHQLCGEVHVDEFIGVSHIRGK